MCDYSNKVEILIPNRKAMVIFSLMVPSLIKFGSLSFKLWSKQVFFKQRGIIPWKDH